MVEADFTEFRELLDATCSLLSRGAYVPNGTNTALFFRALQQHPFEAVRAAFEAHLRDPQRGRFVPTPADLIAQLQGQAAADGRPGAEEAWAMALAAADEDATVVWTEEMSQAWGRAQPVFALGDRIGARMAFREAYERLVDEARKQRTPVRWLASEGQDPRQRTQAIAAAVADGRLPQSDLPALPAPTEGLQLLLIAGTAVQSQAERDGRQKLRELRDRIAAQANSGPVIEAQDSGNASAKEEARAVLAGHASRMRGG